MTRLNAEIRNAIIENAIASSPIPKRKSDLKERRAKLAEELRLLSVGGKETDEAIKKIQKKVKNLLESLPEDILAKNELFFRDYDVAVNVGGERRNFHFNGDEYHSEKSTYKTLSKKMVVVNGGSDLQKEILAIDAEKEDISISETNIRENVRAVIESYKTVEDLVKTWPECEELIPPFAPYTGRNLPAVLPKQLNKMIGLPTEK